MLLAYASSNRYAIQGSETQCSLFPEAFLSSTERVEKGVLSLTVFSFPSFTTNEVISSEPKYCPGEAQLPAPLIYSLYYFPDRGESRGVENFAESRHRHREGLLS